MGNGMGNESFIQRIFSPPLHLQVQAAKAKGQHTGQAKATVKAKQPHPEAQTTKAHYQTVNQILFNLLIDRN